MKEVNFKMLALNENALNCNGFWHFVKIQIMY